MKKKTIKVKKWAIVLNKTILSVPLYRDEQVKQLAYWRSQEANPGSVRLVPCIITYEI